ncbi:hypothetical protein [Haloferula sp. A504]|uniref:hypothetical protein n=1 Tax=Haloferula sp. A504 TaxID=3373601 RepID=UPI0031BDC2E9|nr:hypothetical protein [Verrucomicrobiaceae bacterium E54]
MKAISSAIMVLAAAVLWHGTATAPDYEYLHKPVAALALVIGGTSFIAWLILMRSGD